MKKLFALLAVALGVVACQKDQADMGVNLGGEQEVMINVSLPDETRAGSAQGFDLNNLNGYEVRYILEISYNGHVFRDVQTAVTKSVVFPVRLAPGRDYQFTVWADLVKEGQNDLYYNVLANAQEGVSALSNITFKTWTPNTEARDAWTDTKSIKFGENPDDLSMTLTRPFAKVRVVATDLAKVTYFGITPKSAVAVYSKDMYTSFNAVAGKANTTNVEQKNHTFEYEDVDTYEDATGQFTVFTDYILVPADGTVQFNLEVKDANGGTIKSTNFSTAIPVEKNKVTSIVGDVLTEGGNVSVTVDGALGQKETYTYISDGAELIKAMTKDGKNILGNDIIVTEADLTRAQRNSATRAAANEPKNTVVNLNGYTISVKNTGSGALVTVDEGNTLTFAGEGNIVMDEDSTAPFVENDNNNATIIIEQATVTNESTNQGAVVVDGNAIVNAAADVDTNAVSGERKPQLEYVLANGGEVTLFEDVTSDKILEISATNPVVINGNSKTISFNSNRGFRITASNDVTIENATIVNNVNGGRCIETRTGGITLTLNNVVLTATKGTSQPFTVGGSGDNLNVNINNSTIASGNGGYGITTFNPVALNINNSTITGYAALNIKSASSSLGSAGSKINIVNSDLYGVNNVPADESNSFSTIAIEDNNIEINVDSTSTVKATTSNGNGQAIVGFGNSLVTSLISGCKLTFAGNIVLEGDHTSFVGCSSYQGGLGGNIVKFAAEYADELEAEGWIVGEPTDGLVTIPSAIAQVGDNLYKTLAEAVAAVEDGGTIILVENEVFTKNNRYNNGGWWDGLGYSGDKSFTIDLKNHSISQDGSLNDYLIWFKNDGAKGNTITLKNGTLDAGKTAFCALATSSSNAQKITINLENIELINDNTSGAVVKLRAGAELNIKDGTKIIGKNSYTGIECVASTTNIYEGAEIYQNGTSSSWGCLAGASWGGIINVYGGKGTSARGGFMAMTSGGTINVSGGEWTANVNGTIGNNSNLYVLTAQNNKYENGYKGASIINVTGGTFRGGMDAWILNDVNTEKAELNISGGNFNANPSSYLAEGYGVITKDNTYTVIPTVLEDGDVLDLGGAEYDGKITVEGNVTIKGDTKIKTLTSTTGCIITIEDGKTLTLNNFSFGAKDNADAKYEIKGGTVTANYGFFQHGTYTLRSNFETGYMYYSYGSDITVYGTFHSQGKGDGLDYVRGKLTIANGGKSIHDKSLWVGQPASWGAMNASLVIENGGYVQVNSLSVYEGSSLTYSNDADLKYNSVTGAEYITKK